MGFADSKPAIAMGGGGQRAGGWAHKQVTGLSQRAGRDWPSCCWFLEGPFLSGRVAILSHVAPTRITMLIMAGMGGLHKGTRERGEKKYNLKKT